jgi:hypothetical protein
LDRRNALRPAGGGTILTTVKEGRNNLRELFFPAPSALEVADRQSKLEISRQFIDVTWRRLYRSNQFINRIRRRAPEEEIEGAWHAFLQSVEDMSSKTMMFAIAFGELYTDDVRREYENVIQVDFAEVTKKIVDLRYQLKRHEVEGEELTCKLSKISDDLDITNFKLYQFSSCFDRRLRTPNGCVGGRNAIVIMNSDSDCPKSNSG